MTYISSAVMVRLCRVCKFGQYLKADNSKRNVEYKSVSTVSGKYYVPQMVHVMHVYIREDYKARISVKICSEIRQISEQEDPQIHRSEIRLSPSAGKRPAYDHTATHIPV